MSSVAPEVRVELVVEPDGAHGVAAQSYISSYKNNTTKIQEIKASHSAVCCFVCFLSLFEIKDNWMKRIFRCISPTLSKECFLFIL